jgi:hypothetical protein
LEWRIEDRLTPDKAFKHPFIRAAVDQAEFIKSLEHIHSPISGNPFDRPPRPETMQAKLRRRYPPAYKK